MPAHSRRVALGMAVVALAHPQEVGGEADRLARCRCRWRRWSRGSSALDQARGVDPVPVADVRAEVVLVDHLAHVFQDLRGRRDRRAGPGLEAVAEGVEVAVRADARIAVRDPGAAEALLRFEHDEAGAGALVGEVIGAADAGDAGADDQHVEVFRALLRGGAGEGSGVGHGRRPFRCVHFGLGPMAAVLSSLAQGRALSAWRDGSGPPAGTRCLAIR